jgi:hypothetical protein
MRKSNNGSLRWNRPSLEMIYKGRLLTGIASGMAGSDHDIDAQSEGGRVIA